MRFNRLQEGQAAGCQGQLKAELNFWQEGPTLPSDRQSAICSDAIVPSMGTTKKKGFVVVASAPLYSLPLYGFLPNEAVEDIW